MTLTKFTPETTPQKSQKIPTMRVTVKNGFYINRSAVLLLELSAGDKITIVKQVDEKSPHKTVEWFIQKAENGFQLRNSKGAMVFYAYELAILIMRQCKISADSITINIASEPTTLEDGTIANCILIGSAKTHL